MGYYASVEAASDDIIVGNPQLQVSDVESYDLRAEYVYGNYSDLFAVSGFHKKIEDPIESIIVRDPTNLIESSQALFRTWFNNPSEATVWGLELEARNNLGSLAFGRDELFFLEYFTIGGNGTWIDATVDRTPGELRRATQFFPAGSATTLKDSRRLYSQPKWVANADVSFEQLDWGTNVTLAFYAISDVLDAAGTATVGANNQVQAITLDRYIASYHLLDLVVTQKIWDGLALKFSAKNLTDSRRRVIYDPAEVRGQIEERSFRVGRDYSLELSYTFSEFPDLEIPFWNRE
jgi:outer membrane receptor protein involved in Fe transport